MKRAVIWGIVSVFVTAVMILFLTFSGIGMFAFASLGAPRIVGTIRCFNPRNCSEATREFVQVLQKRFPVGTGEAVLRMVLEDQGFHGLPASITRCLSRGEQAPIGVVVIQCPSWDPNWNPKRHLSYGWGFIPCGSGVGVLWSADNRGIITHIDSYYDFTCL